MSIGGGGIGGLLGGLLGNAIAPGLSDILGFAVPAIASTAGGSFLGSTAGGLASGEPLGKAALGGLESGALTGLTAGLGDVLSGTPLSSSGGLGNLFSGGATSAGTTPLSPSLGDTAAAPLTAGGPAAPAAPISTPGIASSPLGASPGPGPGGGGDIGNIGLSTGSVPTTPLSQLSGGAGTAPQFLLPGTPGAEVGQDVATELAGGMNPAQAATVANALPSATGSGDLGSKILDYIKANPGALLSGGLLGAQALRGTNIPSSLINPLKSNAASLLNTAGGLNTTGAGLTTAGNQNIQAFQTGALPSGAQEAVDQGTNAAKASIRSQFANLGLSGSSMEASALAEADQNSAAQKYAILQNVVNTGLKEVGQGASTTEAGVATTAEANKIYEDILQQTLANDQATQTALARFAAALAGSRTTG